MHVNEFRLERYFAKYEFHVKHLFSCSDCEAIKLEWLLNNADDETLDLWNRLTFSYTDPKGHPLLRKEIASLYSDIQTEGITTIVPEEGIFLTLNALLESGDHVIALAPAYESLLEIPKAIGCRVTPWMLESDGNGWRLNFEFLEKEVTSKTKLMIVNFPHNPTGFIPTKSEWEIVVGFARNHGLTLFSDEMYRGLEMSDDYRLTPASDCYEKGISLSGLSKTYSLPGLRLGWIASNDAAFLKKLSIYKDYTTICGSAPSEILGIIALRNREKIVRKNIDLIKQNESHLKQFADRYPESIDYLSVCGGSTAFPEFKKFSSRDVDAVCEKMADEKSVMVLPGSVFDYPGGHFRAGLGRAAFPGSLDAVEEFLLENRLI